MTDARFEDARGGPLRLRALDADDLQVVSSLCQDAVFPITEMAWDRKARRFGLLLNRLRREDRLVAQGTQVERVQAVLAIEDVTAVQTHGIDRAEADMVLSVLAITMEAGDDGTGRIVVTLSGDGAVAIDVEALEVTLRDVTRPYQAPSGKVPSHGD